MNCATNSVAQFLILYSKCLCSEFFKMPSRSTKTQSNRDQKCWHIATTLSSNGHEKTKETSKYKKLLISKKEQGS